MYTIEIEYQTGNSFGSEDLTERIDPEWEDLDKAKESLQRLKNHYEFYMDNNNEYVKPKCKFPYGVKWDNEFRMIKLELIDDNGNEFLYSPFWTGYFETLYGASIISVNDDSLTYRPN